MDVVFEGRTLDEAGLMRHARALALKLRPGDTVALRGDLGAGKSTFARAFIRAALGDGGAEVPSPTFSIEQTYETARGVIAHYDLYRLSGPDELAEIGWEQRIGADLVLVEWPERAAGLLPDARIELDLAGADDEAVRNVSLKAHASVADRVRRAVTIADFVGGVAAWRDAEIVYLQGDASQRAYARLRDGMGKTAVLMDSPRQPDGPPVRDGKPYSRIAHLAEDVSSFVRISGRLAETGLVVPEVIAADEMLGLLLLTDLGDLQFGTALDCGIDQRMLWTAALDCLVHLRRANPSRDVGRASEGAMPLPRFDRAALEIEVGLMLDWYWRHHVKAPLTDDIAASFWAAWAPVFDRMQQRAPGWFLRDYHSPNLLWQPERQGIGRVGIIDFQDALGEHWAYDVASLLQDARRDVPRGLEQDLLQRYMAEIGAVVPDFDGQEFLSAYADFGAQRNTRLIGLWVRLLKRDGKPNYLQHMPRTWDYLERNLAHPGLASVKAWFDQHISQVVRKKPVER
ncbi:MAG: hypothetical protein RL291_2050 [Pseudomonadota bacterium]